MKKIRTRALFVLMIAFFVMAGMVWFVREDYLHGRRWAMAFSTFDNEAEGQLLDCNGVPLAAFGKGKRDYSGDYLTRVANYHVTGDFNGMSGTGVLTRFWGSAQDYDFVNGTSVRRHGTVFLGVDAKADNYAYTLLNSSGKGTVMVLNYRTGEVKCLVSCPSADPVDTEREVEDSAYLNRALSATYIPGSTFKLITSAAALESLPDLETMQFTCWGEYDIAGIKITCEEAHGVQTFEQALANSCNCAFAQITVQVGQKRMVQHVTDYGFLSGHTINGIYTSAGNYPLTFVGDPELAWSGIGQSVDQVCPFSMLRYVAAIANDGVLAEPSFLKTAQPEKTTQLVRPDTAARLQQLMRNNVKSHYEQYISFPGLELCAKTGTAETGAGTSHSWFTGFVRSETHPYAFVAVVEEGGYGLWSAGVLVNDLLQFMVNGN
ncbi:MAG: hypothetical protein IJI61_09870 [Oscillospiraceae bacterium]|nr:hypothetical protein [Oscillospiraceae bacterium]